MTEESTFQKLRESERKLRKHLIVDAAMALFSRNDFENIGIRDIAKKAGISAAAIYRYFPGRDEILIEALTRHMFSISDAIDAKLGQENVNLEVLTLLSVDYLIDNESMYHMIGHFMTTEQADPKIMEKYIEIQEGLLNLAHRVLRKLGIGNESRLAAHAIYAFLLGIVMNFHNHPDRCRDETRKHIHRLCRLVSRLFETGTFPNEEEGDPFPGSH